MHAVYYESSLLNGVIVPGLTQDSPQVCAFFPMLSSCRHCQTERNFQNLHFIHNHASQGTPLVQIFLFLLSSWHQYSILQSWRKKKELKNCFIFYKELWSFTWHCVDLKGQGSLWLVCNSLCSPSLSVCSCWCLFCTCILNNLCTHSYIVLINVCSWCACLSYSFPASMLTGLVVSIWWNIFLA